MLKHPISPTVDCIFKAILGAEENKNLLIDFLKSVLAPPKPSLPSSLPNARRSEPTTIIGALLNPHLRIGEMAVFRDTEP